MIRVYTASKLEEYKRWLQIQKEHPGVYFHARWIKHMEIGTPDRSERAQEFWLQDQEDVESADVLLLYETPGGRPLKGGLVEAGMALSKGVPVIAVGNVENIGNWVYHPGVTLVDTLEEALKLLDQMSVGWRLKATCHLIGYKEVFVPWSELNNTPWDGGSRDA